MIGKEIIEKLEKGDTERTFLHAAFANEILRILNKRWVVILPANGGTADFLDAHDKVTLDLSQANFTSTGTVLPDPPGPGTFVLTSIDDVLTWTATTDCA